MHHQLAPSVGKIIVCVLQFLSLTKGCMVRTRSRATSPDHQESRDASSNPHRDRQLALVMQPSSIQHVQSMAAAMAELTRQNQELTSKINLRRQRHEGYAKGQTQSQEDRGNAEFESQSKGTTSRKVPYLEREMDQMRKVMDKMRENMRRVNLIEDLVPRIYFLFTASINGHPLPSKFKMPSLDSYDGTRDPFDYIATFKTTMHLQGFQTRLCVEPSLPPSKGQRECGSARYL